MAALQKGTVCLLTSIFLLILLVFNASYADASGEDKDNIDRVIIVTIDTLRADHLSSYGYNRETSPFLDSMASEGIIFKKAFVPMSVTASSHASLFTSLYPLQHGVQKNGPILDDSFLTMAEVFKRKGFKTAAFTSIFLLETGNIDQGFSHFDSAPMVKLGDKHDPVPKYRSATDTIDLALKWLKAQKRGDKIFLWIHLFDPHRPLNPPKEYYGKFLYSSTQQRTMGYLRREQHVLDIYDNKRMYESITKYDAEILYADTELKRLYDTYNELGFRDKSLWVFTADHGEGLGAHNFWGHGDHIYNEQIRVPMIFRLSSGQAAGTVVDTMVENIDVFPTIFELVDSDMKPFKRIMGKSLLPLFLPKRAKSTYTKEYAFAQRRTFNKKDPDEMFPDNPPSFEEGEKYSLQTKDYKYIYLTELEDEFYDLNNDPYEVNNLIKTGSPELKRLKRKLLNMIDELKVQAPAEQEVKDKDLIERLKSLGYIQ